MKQTTLLFLIVLLCMCSGCRTPATDLPETTEGMCYDELGGVILGDYTLYRRQITEYDRESDTYIDMDLDSYMISRYTGTASEIVLPETAPDGLPIIEIGAWAFNECTTLKKVTIPDSYQIIREWSFQRCDNLEEIYIGAGVNDFSIVEVFAFSNRLSSIQVDPRNPVYESKGNCLLTKGGKLLVAGCKDSMIPDTVTEIGENAFCNIESLNAIELPPSVTMLNNFAFFGCVGLTEFRVPLHVKQMGYSVFHNCPNLTIYCEAEERPEGWNIAWDGRNHGEVTERYPLPTVIWGAGTGSEKDLHSV